MRCGAAQSTVCDNRGVTHLAAVSVTYGAAPLVHALCASFRRHSPRDARLIVIAQPDDAGECEAERVAAMWPWVDVITPGENLGFAGANNLGVATAGDVEVIAFLNPDIELTEGWATPLLAALDDPQVGIAAPVLLTPEGDIDEAGQAVFSDGGSVAVGGPEWPGYPQSYESVMIDRDVDYASAACWMMRRAVFDELGGFSDAYWPAYFEDNDLAQRARQAGYVTRLCTTRPVVHHRHGASAERVAIAERSRAVFERTWADLLPTKPDRALLTSDPNAVRDWYRGAR